MKIEQAIEMAIENGWDDGVAYGADTDYGDPKVGVWYYPKHIFLDPSFWQSLGKAMGWWQSFPESDSNTETYWRNQWHRFIDHLADNKNVESFFADLK